jgi:hypothetical protein
MEYEYVEFHAHAGDRLVLRVTNPQRDYIPFGAAVAPHGTLHADHTGLMLVYGSQRASPELRIASDGVWVVELGVCFLNEGGASVIRISPDGQENTPDRRCRKKRRSGYREQRKKRR